MKTETERRLEVALVEAEALSRIIDVRTRALEAAEAEVTRLTAEHDRLALLIRQGAAESLCPDMRTHGERVHRIVAEVEAAEARADEASARIAAALELADKYEGAWIDPTVIRDVLGGAK